MQCFTFQDGDYDQLGDAATKFEPPYDARAKLFKEQFSLGDQLKDQLEFKNNENYELKKMVNFIQSGVSPRAIHLNYPSVEFSWNVWNGIF